MFSGHSFLLFLLLVVGSGNDVVLLKVSLNGCRTEEKFEILHFLQLKLVLIKLRLFSINDVVNELE